MRSAYLVLGVPGNASQEDIEIAFRTAQKLFPRERLAEEEGALARLNELKTAYQVLRDPESRAAHDRKLQGAIPAPARPRTVIVEEESSGLATLLRLGVLVVAVLGAVGFGINRHNVQVRQEREAQELAARKAAEAQAALQREAEDRQAAARAQAAAQEEAASRRLAVESQYSADRAAAMARAAEASEASARRMAAAQQRQADAARQAEDQRAAYEARMRVERDKARIRELCWQQYQRPNC